MWGRNERETSYGYVDKLDPSFIDPSPEGLWDFYLPPGTTTDDTRWKSLTGNFVVQHLESFYLPQGPSPYDFAEHILNSYQKEVQRLKKTPGNDPTAIELNIRRLTWLQEWATVAEPFADGDLEAYTSALHRFYGGDLLCAGMLYAPALGLPYPGDALTAYNTAYRLGIFDQGYARDITGLTAAMIAAAMSPNATKSAIMEVFRTVDPNEYFRSRLFGREAFKTFRAAEQIAKAAKELKECHPEMNTTFFSETDSLSSCRLNLAFELLDQRNQHSPAHAQEILLVTLTGLLYSNFEFQPCMEFITNYGRDNDTSGAVAGSILGAYLGFQQLPETFREQVLATNSKNLGIDLEKLANDFTEKMMVNHL
jgi:ADP-ribosylglycohydrolase